LRRPLTGVGIESLQARWRSFVRRPFPRGCAANEVNGVCLPSTDSLAAGCIETFVSTDQLDAERTGVLRHCLADLQRAAPALAGEARAYFTELEALARLVLWAAERSR
jgi:hypothetical protein